MRDDINTRRVEVLKDGEWRSDVDFMDMRPGDVFRLFKPDGTLVLDNEGSDKFLVKKPPVVREDGVQSVEAVAWEGGGVV